MTKGGHSIPAAPLQPCCGVKHGNQKDVRLSILYKVEIVMIYYVVYLFIYVFDDGTDFGLRLDPI